MCQIALRGKGGFLVEEESIFRPGRVVNPWFGSSPEMAERVGVRGPRIIQETRKSAAVTG